MELKQPESPMQNNKRASPSGKDSTFVINGNNGSSLVEQILLELGWKKLADKNSDNFKLKWVENKNSVNYDALKEGEQMVNRIPNCFLLTNKLGLLTSLQRYERVWTMLNLGRIIKLRTSDFIPETYRLDDNTERRIFYEIFKPSDMWICKPTGLNQGRGIFLVRNLEEFRKSVAEREELEKKQQRPTMERVIQRYITNPLLLDGRKFDLRVFMLVASTAPFLILFHKGYARLCLQMYNNQAEDLTAHLTNQFVQKRDATYEYFKEETIWSIEKLNNYINKKVAPLKGLETDWVLNTLTNRIKQIMLYCFHAVKHKLKSRVGYFDLYGLDFLVDDNMKVWLIEINANPCLATNCDTLKEVIPSVVQESLYLAIECFEKSRRGHPLYPLETLRNFKILFNGSHSSAYQHPNNPSLKRSWSLVSSSLRNQPSRDDQEKDDEKTAKDFSRNYMTSIVFESPDEQNYSSVPVSMFDLNSIENRKLLVDNGSNHTNSLSSSEKSLTLLNQNVKPINLSFMKRKRPEPDKETEDSSRKHELYKGRAPNSPILHASPKHQTASEKFSKHQKPDKSNNDEVIIERSDKDQMKLEKLSTVQMTEKSSIYQPTSVESYKDQTNPDTSSKDQVTDASTTNQIKSDRSVKKQYGKDQSTAYRSKGLLISDKFNRGLTSWDKMSPSIAQLTEDQDTRKRHLSRSLFDLSGFRSITSTLESQSSTEDSQPTVSAKLKAEELSPTFLNLSTPTKPVKQQTGLKPQKQAAGSVRAKPEEVTTSSLTRTGPNINSFMKPIQFLSSNHSYHEKKSGPLDSIVEQLEKDLAKAKIIQTMSRPNREYRLVNTDIFGNSISDNNMMRNYHHPITNQEYAYSPLNSRESNKATDRSSTRFQYADRSKTLSKIYPMGNTNSFPVQENKSYISPNVISAYSFTNAHNRTIPSSEYDVYPSAEWRNPRGNQITDRKSTSSSEYTDGQTNRFSTVRKDRPPEKYSEIVVDKKSWELKGEMLYKEATKNALKERMATGAMYNTGVWNQHARGISGTMLQDAAESPAASRQPNGYTSYGASNGSMRVFPDPDIWLAGHHRTTAGNQHQVTLGRSQNNVDKDWGHFTVVSPK